jgi:cell division septal protein FtsQ
VAREARPTRFNWRFWLRAAVWLGVGTSLALAAREVQRFSVSDPHFVLPGPPPPGENAPEFTIQGLRFASRDRIVQVFQSDFGRSVFEIPLGERRRRLLGVDWVAAASVSRIWPNRLTIRIQERSPVAFASLPQRGLGSRIALIDADGVILEKPPRSKFSFPILTGLSERQSEKERSVQVSHFLRLQQELGSTAKAVSEVDLSSVENLKITLPVEGTVVELHLGDRNLAWRCQNFLNHFTEIRKRSPQAAVFDLRLDDRITARE